MNHKHASIRSARHAPTDPELSYLPGMGRDWLLPLYDPITRLLRLRSAHRRLSD